MDVLSNKEEEVPMTVDTVIPNGDIVAFANEQAEEAKVQRWNHPDGAANVLVISEEGGMLERLVEVQYSLSIKYFQRLPDETPYIASEDDVIEHIASWRPYVGWADIIIVDDPSYVARIAKDFNLNGKLVLYRVNNKAREEAERLMHWLNPLTLTALKDAMENVDFEPVDIKIVKSKWWKRLFGGSRG